MFLRSRALIWASAQIVVNVRVIHISVIWLIRASMSEGETDLFMSRLCFRHNFSPIRSSCASWKCQNLVFQITLLRSINLFPPMFLAALKICCNSSPLLEKLLAPYGVIISRHDSVSSLDWVHLGLDRDQWASGFTIRDIRTLANNWFASCLVETLTAVQNCL